MSPFLFKRDTAFYFLSLILILAVILRFYGLTYQSLWVDELHTMVEADPSASYRYLFDYLKCCDTQPPLFYLIEKILFTWFSHSEGVARGLPAVCGVLGVWAMYLLGKEVMNKKLGLIAALITCVNFFSIGYSQEARSYTLAMLLSVFSFLYFIKLIKDPGYKYIAYYVLFTVLLLYTHYYSLFIVTAQGLIALIFMLGVKENRKQYFNVFAISGVLIGLGYLPWLPFFFSVSGVRSIWISPPPPDFAIDFFIEYFGSNPIIESFLALLMAYFFWQIGKQKNWSLVKVRESPIQLTFLVFAIAIAITYIIPYVRSVLVVPMLLSRYTIVILPGFILFIAFAFTLINSRLLQAALISLFVIISLWNHIYVNRYYSTIRKTQFREMTQFISRHPKNQYPIVEEVTDWQHAYYLKRFDVKMPMLSGPKKATIDSILNKRNAKYDLEGFWLVGAHGSSFLDSAAQSSLDTAYQLTLQQDYYDAWCQLYERHKTTNKETRPRDVTRYFSNEPIKLWWNGTIESKPIPVKQGQYRVIFFVRGTEAGSEFPHINLYIDNKKTMDFFTTENYSENSFLFETLEGRSIILKLEYDNDKVIDGEDRNVFVQAVRFVKLN